jgi:hypothetical protein
MSSILPAKRRVSEMSGDCAEQRGSFVTRILEATGLISNEISSPSESESSSYLDESADLARDAWETAKITQQPQLRLRAPLEHHVQGISIYAFAEACMPDEIPHEIVFDILVFADMTYTTTPGRHDVYSNRVRFAMNVKFKEELEYEAACNTVAFHNAHIAIRQVKHDPACSTESWKKNLSERMDMLNILQGFSPPWMPPHLGHVGPGPRASDPRAARLPRSRGLIKFMSSRIIRSFQMLNMRLTARKQSNMYWYMHIDWLLLVRGEFPDLKIRFETPLQDWLCDPSYRFCVLSQYRCVHFAHVSRVCLY